MSEAPLDSFLAYYTVLAAERRQLRGATVLHTPGSPLLGANAAYLHGPPESRDDGLARAALWLHARGAAPLFAAPVALTGEPVVRLQVGRYRASGEGPSEIAVEQVSRFHTAALSGVLATAWALPEWAELLGLSLGRALKGEPAVTWLGAYDLDGLVGALLLLGSAAHLWGVTRPDALVPLLDAAAGLAGGEVGTSTVEAFPLPLAGAAELHFNLGAAVQVPAGTLLN